MKSYIAAFVISLAPLLWLIETPRPDVQSLEARVNICMNSQSIQVEPLLRPEVHKLCRCTVEQLDRRLNKAESNLFFRFLPDRSRERAISLLNNLPPADRGEMARHIESAMLESAAKCGHLMYPKVPS